MRKENQSPSELIESLLEQGDMGGLLDMLESSEKVEVKRRAAWALGKLGQAGAVETLIPYLHQEDLCRTAAKALGRIGDPRAVDPLIRSLADFNLRTTAKNALVMIGDPAVEALLRALEDHDELIKTGARMALEEMRDHPRVAQVLSQSAGRERKPLPARKPSPPRGGFPALQVFPSIHPVEFLMYFFVGVVFGGLLSGEKNGFIMGLGFTLFFYLAYLFLLRVWTRMLDGYGKVISLIFTSGAILVVLIPGDLIRRLAYVFYSGYEEVVVAFGEPLERGG